MRISGKNAIVTGAAGGIGRATVLHLAEHGAARIKAVDIDVETLRRISDVNLNAVVLGTQIAAHAMQPRGGGVIVQTVSTVALGSGFYDALYAATKTGLMMFLRCCAGLKEEMGVRVVGVLPGLVDTGILKTTGGDDYAPWMHTILANNPACRPDDIAAAVIDLIEDDSIAGGDWVAVRMIDGKIEREWGHAPGV